MLVSKICQAEENISTEINSQECLEKFTCNCSIMLLFVWSGGGEASKNSVQIVLLKNNEYTFFESYQCAPKFQKFPSIVISWHYNRFKLFRNSNNYSK